MEHTKEELDGFVDQLFVADAVYIARRLNSAGTLNTDERCERGKHYACQDKDVCICPCHINRPKWSR